MINLKSELQTYWQDVHSKSINDQSIMSELERELLEKTYKSMKV